MVGGCRGSRARYDGCMLIGRIYLQNIRGFRELDIDLQGDSLLPRRRTLIIGKNGTCKTSVLRAIALGLCDFQDANALLAEPIGRLVSTGASEGRIEIFGREGAANFHLGLVIRRSENKEVIH